MVFINIIHLFLLLSLRLFLYRIRFSCAYIDRTLLCHVINIQSRQNRKECNFYVLRIKPQMKIHIWMELVYKMALTSLFCRYKWLSKLRYKDNTILSTIYQCDCDYNTIIIHSLKNIKHLKPWIKAHVNNVHVSIQGKGIQLIALHSCYDNITLCIKFEWN